VNYNYAKEKGFSLYKKVPRKPKKTFGDETRPIFYASPRKDALDFIRHFNASWEKDIPTAIKFLKNFLEACLIYMHFKRKPRLLWHKKDSIALSWLFYLRIALN